VPARLVGIETYLNLGLEIVGGTSSNDERESGREKKYLTGHEPDMEFVESTGENISSI